MDAEEIIQRVRSTGYAVIRRLAPRLSTEQVALKLGSIMDVSSNLPGVPIVQILQPRKPDARLMNQYSGTYGIEEFPLHSDLAHWYLPPRYLMLRCKVGAKDVETKLISYSAIVSAIGERTLKQALVVPRRKSNGQKICPLPVFFCQDGSWGIRWDFLFLSPLNDSAKRTFEVFASHSWHDEEIISVNLLQSGDTIIIDNWRMLHGRSAVPEGSMNRVIERIYLNTLGA
ncbi:Fe(II)-2OG oxygenase family protein [Methylosarcina fibrata]|uniref:TauD/TfdA family dioxygenase n=1 Tax=Methylosarcina fibrata TaxID=105972 RepID=UPI000368A5D5|nr:TauD/TfdA family dioxygenase [Methylosarcina fibrata]